MGLSLAQRELYHSSVKKTPGYKDQIRANMPRWDTVTSTAKSRFNELRKANSQRTSDPFNFFMLDQYISNYQKYYRPEMIKFLNGNSYGLMVHDYIVESNEIADKCEKALQWLKSHPVAR